MPPSACRFRVCPSKENGRVTTATVSAPTSLATSATTGPAPVPVPPPRPAVMNTMSAPVSASRIRSRSSRAAWRPMSGLAPAPSPLVSRAPSWSLRGARFRDSACASVLAAMNSTPCSPSSIIVLMALPPPPPTPNTLMTAWQRFSSMIVNIRFPLASCSVLAIRSSFSPGFRIRKIPTGTA